MHWYKNQDPICPNTIIIEVVAFIKPSPIILFSHYSLPNACKIDIRDLVLGPKNGGSERSISLPTFAQLVNTRAQTGPLVHAIPKSLFSPLYGLTPLRSLYLPRVLIH